MKILVTGAFGNIGNKTVACLLEKGYQVRCFDIDTAGNRKSAKVFGKNIETVWGDLRSDSDTAAAVKGVDMIIHLAYIIPPLSEKKPVLSEIINVGGTRRLVNAALMQPVKPGFIFASSVAVYGSTQQLKPPRTAGEQVRPEGHYALHKVESEKIVTTSGLKWCILRFGAAPAIKFDSIDPIMFEVPLNDRIEFVHPADVACAVANAAGSEEVWGKILLIGGGAKCRILQREFMEQSLGALGLEMLPDSAFGNKSFYTDWMDTAESERLLKYQKSTLADYLKEQTGQLGLLKNIVKLFKPFARAVILNKSPYYKGAAWKDKVAVITGASSGIGASIAKGFAANGITVVLVARRLEKLEMVAEEIRKAGGRAYPVQADLSDENERLKVFNDVLTNFGRADILVNNAGFGWYGYGCEMDWQTAGDMITLNIGAVVHFTLLFLRHMKKKNSGHIINIGSISASIPSQGVAIYGATKAFIDSFTTSLFRELKNTGIHIGVIKPGPVLTEFFDTSCTRPGGCRVPAEKFGIKPEVVAAKAFFMLKHPRKKIYVPFIYQFVPLVELLFGRIIDMLGPMLLRRSMSR